MVRRSSMMGGMNESASDLAGKRERLRILAGLFGLILLIGFVLRVVLLVQDGGTSWWGSLLAVVLGIVNDGLTAVVALTPLACWLWLSGGGSLVNRWWRIAMLTGIIAGLLFGAAVEYYFFAEFNARFNHIAVDYLLFPGEVATNVWQSYNVPLFLGLSVALGGGAAWGIDRWIGAAPFAPMPIRRRLQVAVTAIGMGIISVIALGLIPAHPQGDRRTDEVAANGLVQLVRAFATSHLSYEDYYRVMPADAARQRAAQEVGWSSPTDPQRTFTAAVDRAKPLDVVVILEESLGSEFVKRLDGSHPATPGLERWMPQSLLLSNLVATGNRTVRGLEGVLCSFPPLPGDSIWKREKSERVATIAGILKDQGYQTQFFYGGAGAFDGMKPFALANGWQDFIEDGIVASDFPADAFRTAWGVEDGQVFKRLLEHQHAAAAAGRPFFGTLLTTSNHKPFLTPDSKDVRHSADRLKAAGLVGLEVAAGLIVAWLLLRRRIGVVQLGLVTGLIITAYGIWAWVKIQPRDTRTHAVAYADKMLTAYLDQAKADGLLDHTVVLIVGDHGARVYGAEEIPAGSYRIPGVIIAPDERFHGMVIDQLCSQIDLAPTVLSIAGVSYRAPFFGRDLLRSGDLPGRAWLIHNRDIGLLTDRELVVLGLQRSVTTYRRPDRGTDAFQQVPVDAGWTELIDRATGLFQAASELYEGRSYALPAKP